jgi:hypothetical protein
MPRGRTFTAEEIARGNAHPSRRNYNPEQLALARAATRRERRVASRVGEMSPADLAVRSERADYAFIVAHDLIDVKRGQVVG